MTMQPAQSSIGRSAKTPLFGRIVKGLGKTESSRCNRYNNICQNLFFHIMLSTGLLGWPLYFAFDFWLYLISISPSTGK